MLHCKTWFRLSLASKYDSAIRLLLLFGSHENFYQKLQR